MLMAIDKELDQWRDRMEIDLDEIRGKLYGEEAGVYLAKWLGTPTPCAREVLTAQLGLDPELKGKKLLEAVREHPKESLLPFVLADEALTRKRGSAVIEVARQVLTADELNRCMRDGQYDRRALVWMLVGKDPAHIEQVIHRERACRKGYLRMVANDLPAFQIDPEKYFTRENIQTVIERREREKGSEELSRCIAVLKNDGLFLVIVKREHKKAFVLQRLRNVFGFTRDWLCLEFEQDLRRVYIASAAPRAPVLLANRILSECCGREIAYEKELLYTPIRRVEDFLRLLIAEPTRVPLVDVHIISSRLHNAPAIAVIANDGMPIDVAIEQLAPLLGSLAENLALLKSVTVKLVGQDMCLYFAPGTENGEVLISYDNRVLHGSERHRFESMMSREFGLIVVPKGFRDGCG